MIRYANVNGESREPEPGLQGTCPGCGKPVVARCGTVNIHHWARKIRQRSDPWWEPMTQWHIDWQNRFPAEWREKIIRHDGFDDFHRADIYTPQGITIEFQHSALTFEELCSRNDFYKKMIWFVIAQPLKDKSSLLDLENPSNLAFNDYDFITDKEGFTAFPQSYKKSEYRDYGPAFSTVYGLNSMIFKADNEDSAKASFKYNLFSWKNRRRVWLKSSAPEFLYFGDALTHNEMRTDRTRSLVSTDCRRKISSINMPKCVDFLLSRSRRIIVVSYHLFWTSGP